MLHAIATFFQSLLALVGLTFGHATTTTAIQLATENNVQVVQQSSNSASENKTKQVEYIN